MVVVLSWAASAGAQVVLDGTLGPAGALSGPDFQITSDLGRTVGPNLFHSFSEFSLAAGQAATFSGPDTIANVLGRVTGGEASVIDGSLRSTIPGANLYLINPWGVVFGPDAQLDTSGSVAVSSADYLLLGDGGRFDAAQPAQSLLTGAPVEAFGFLGDATGALRVQGASLAVKPDRQLSLVGGEVGIQGGELSAPDGTIQILSAETAGDYELPSAESETPWVAPAGASLGPIGLSEGAALRVEGQGRGTVWIRGGQLVAESASVEVSNDGDGDGSTVDVALTDELRLRASAQILGRTTQAGTGPSMSIQARSVRIEDHSSIATEASATASGRAGSITLEAEHLELVDDGRVSSVTHGPAQGGAVHVKAATLEVDGGGRKDEAGIQSTTLDPSGLGRAGDILVQAETCRLFDGGEISASTQGLADAGNVTLEASDLLIDSMYRVVPENPEDRPGTGIFSRASGTGESGDGGDVLVSADGVSLRAGEISVSTRGAGQAGSLRVEAGQLSIDGRGVPSGLFAQSLSQDQPGQGGDLAVVADRVTIVDTGRIQASTFGPGTGGSLTVTAGDIVIDGEDALGNQSMVGIFAQSVSEGAGGDAGAIVIEADRLTLLAGGDISASTSGLGSGGDVTIRVDELRLDGKGILTAIGVNSYNPTEGGPAGNLTIEAGLVELVNVAEISAGTFGSGRGGNLTIVAEEILIDDSPTPRNPYFSSKTGILANSIGGATGNAGDLRIEAGRLKMINGASLSAGTSAPGDGGTLTIHAETIELEGKGKYTWIGANTIASGAGGDAGDLAIVADTLTLSGWCQISAMTLGQGGGGRLSVTADEVVIDGQGYSAGLSVASQGAVDGGAAGDLTLQTRTLQLIRSGALSATTFGSGAAGNILVTADDVLIDGRRSTAPNVPGIVAQTIIGVSGDVTLQVRNTLEILGYGLIDASTYGSAAGGAVNIEAARIHVDGAGRPGSISAGSQFFGAVYPSDSGGQGGEVAIVAKEIIIEGGGSVSTSTSREGPAGSVEVLTETLSIRDGGSVQSRSTGRGAAGRIAIQSSEEILLAGGGTISSSSRSSDGGGIQIASGTTFTLEQSEVTAQADLDGGNISISAGEQLYLLESRIDAEAGDDGGNLDLSSPLSVLNRSQITANAIQGNGGDILVDSPYLLSSVDSTISASSEFGVAGQISILGPALDLTGGLRPLDPYLVEFRAELPPHCGVNVGGQVSTFVLTGVSGIPMSPLGWQPVWPTMTIRFGDLKLGAPPDGSEDRGLR